VCALTLESRRKEYIRAESSVYPFHVKNDAPGEELDGAYDQDSKKYVTPS
jgi:hypothetical protein